MVDIAGRGPKTEYLKLVSDQGTTVRARGEIFSGQHIQLNLGSDDAPTKFRKPVYSGRYNMKIPTGEPMNGLTREELDAKLEARDAKAEARLARFEEKIEQAIGEMRRDSQRYDQSLREVKSEIAGSRNTTVSLIIGSALTVLFGVAGINYSLFSVFDSGRETGSSIEKATFKLESITNEIKRDYQNTQNKIDKLEKEAKEVTPPLESKK